MFNKPKAKTPVASPEATALTDAPRRQPSRIGVDLQVRGSVVGDGWLQLEGQIKGDVHVGRLFVEETGAVEGAVSAEAVEVGGRIQGPITAREVRVAATGYVQGDITTEKLSIDSGAYFQGRCTQIQPQVKPILPEARPDPAQAVEADSETSPSSPLVGSFSTAPAVSESRH